jgi:hypothetical protein
MDARANGRPSSAADFEARVRRELNAHRPPMLTIKSGGSGHAIVAYDVHHLANGNVVADVYNPNIQFQPAEATSPGFHSSQESQSTLTMTPNGNWSSSNPNWTGGLGAISVIPSDVPPDPGRGDYPNRDVTDIIFGAGASVTDGAGHPVAAIDNVDALDSGSIARLSNARGPFTITPGAGGAVSALSAGFEMSVDPAGAGSGSAAAARPAQIVLDPQRQTLDARGASATVSVSVKVPGGERVATVSGAAGARVAFSKNGSSVSVAASKPVRVTLTAAGKDEDAVTLSGLRPGARAVLTPRGWGRLSAAPIAIRTKAGTRNVRGHAATAGSIRIGAVKLVRVAGHATAAVRLGLNGVPRSTVVSVGVVLLRGRRAVAKAGAAVAAGAHSVSIALPKARAGSYRIVAVAVAAGGAKVSRTRRVLTGRLR